MTPAAVISPHATHVLSACEYQVVDLGAPDGDAMFVLFHNIMKGMPDSYMEYWKHYHKERKIQIKVVSPDQNQSMVDMWDPTMTDKDYYKKGVPSPESLRQTISSIICRNDKSAQRFVSLVAGALADMKAAKSDNSLNYSHRRRRTMVASNENTLNTIIGLERRYNAGEITDLASHIREIISIPAHIIGRNAYYPDDGMVRLLQNYTAIKLLTIQDDNDYNFGHSGERETEWPYQSENFLESPEMGDGAFLPLGVGMCTFSHHGHIQALRKYATTSTTPVDLDYRGFGMPLSEFITTTCDIVCTLFNMDELSFLS